MESIAGQENSPITMWLENSPDPMWIYDVNTLAFLKVNECAIRAYGFSEKEFLEMTVLDIRPSKDVERFLHSWKHLHESTGEKWWHTAKDGRAFPVSITSWKVDYEGHEAEVVLARRAADASLP